jgi:hypothetical protein
MAHGAAAPVHSQLPAHRRTQEVVRCQLLLFWCRNSAKPSTPVSQPANACTLHFGVDHGCEILAGMLCPRHQRQHLRRPCRRRSQSSLVASRTSSSKRCTLQYHRKFYLLYATRSLCASNRKAWDPAAKHVSATEALLQ